MHIPALIEKKRDGGKLSAEEIHALISRYSAGVLPDYQMAAFAMAVFFRGMDDAETTALTVEMRDSGDAFAWPAGTPPKVDKHSTGGVGDKVSLILAPLLACEGVWVPMISGPRTGIHRGNARQAREYSRIPRVPCLAGNAFAVGKSGMFHCRPNGKLLPCG